MTYAKDYYTAMSTLLNMNDQRYNDNDNDDDNGVSDDNKGKDEQMHKNKVHDNNDESEE